MNNVKQKCVNNVHNVLIVKGKPVAIAIVNAQNVVVSFAMMSIVMKIVNYVEMFFVKNVVYWNVKFAKIKNFVINVKRVVSNAKKRYAKTVQRPAHYVK